VSLIDVGLSAKLFIGPLPTLFRGTPWKLYDKPGVLVRLARNPDLVSV
jgi:hypothetical protein